MTKVLVATEKPFARIATDGIKKIVEEAGFEFALLENYTTAAELLAAVKDADAMIVRSDLVTKEVTEAADKLKIVVRAGAGYDNLDLEACTAKGIVAMNTPGQNSNAVAELVFLLLLHHLRKGFAGKSGSELRGKKLGIHAFGYVGQYVAEIAQGFGMKVFAYDPYIPEDKMTGMNVTPLKTVQDLYSGCQIISLHIPATAETKKSINFNLLNLMPKGAVLVNTARKEVIDEEGLINMFSTRPDFAYLSDIEPECKEKVAAEFPGRMLTTAKKMGAQTEEANINAGLAAARQIVGFIREGNRTFQVNK